MQDHPQYRPKSRPSAAAAPWSRRAFLGTGAVALAGLTLGMAEPALATPAGPGTPHGAMPFGPVVVADPGSGAAYARAVRLGSSRSWLATFQQFGAPGFPIYRSDDDGHTWSKLSNVPSTGDTSGVWLQPFLYELPRPFAGFPKGTLLCAGNALGNFTSTKIQLYASRDHGVTWTFLSTVAEGGPPIPENGNTPVWEPFLLLHKDRLICYYSDQRDPRYGQKLAHQSSRNLRSWGPVVDDAVGTDYDQRPGMTTVARIHERLWILTHEAGGNSGDNFYAVHYKLATDPESFGPARDIVLHDQDGYIPSAAPTVSWSDSGGPNGTIVVTANGDQDLFVNRHLGDPGKWTRVSSAIPGGYSRQTIPLGCTDSRRRGLLFIITGPNYAENGPIQAGVVPLA
ncbi:glycoside hydrolase [Actinoplanes sp. KI2]|uniref:sialidase family protein n=1 Tax=Actinoplanes sp. KI2 TaxID=2983315 RepID=UPI0021D5E3B2|nr:sialidase family protein [Actinoplanes sp. KI2]MCU7723917.1 glycoside hydrolase [Actinoplanes sp. KI2]